MNRYAFGRNADAVAYAVGTFAMSLDDLHAPVQAGNTVNGVSDAHGDEHHPEDVAE